MWCYKHINLVHVFCVTKKLSLLTMKVQKKICYPWMSFPFKDSNKYVKWYHWEHLWEVMIPMSDWHTLNSKKFTQYCTIETLISEWKGSHFKFSTTLIWPIYLFFTDCNKRDKMIGCQINYTDKWLANTFVDWIYQPNHRLRTNSPKHLKLFW